ncbi:MAG: hypothetical protein EXS36_05150 [Pedosphaera sp.]|nr:hypothetical protein [Pedosphaera sp.]
MLIRARTVVPVVSPPIEDGALVVSEGMIRAVGSWRDLRNEWTGMVEDLGEAIVVPGLVNGHCHLDYTDLAGQLAPPREFTDWIKSILAARSSWGFSEYASSWLKGADQLRRYGITSVANVESTPEILAHVRAAVSLRVFSFLELTGIRSGRSAAELVGDALYLMDALDLRRGAIGLSPHAPYSTRSDLVERVAREARQEGLRVTMHVAESLAEFDMFAFRRGPMFDWLKSQRAMEDCGVGSPVAYLDRWGLLDTNLLAVHGNYLWRDDARILASRGVSVAHCPQSHAYFRHQRFPYRELLESGVNVCLGTDSLASTRASPGKLPHLSLFDELHTFQKAEPDVPPKELLRMVTVNAARALGWRGRAGQLTPGAWADLAVLREKSSGKHAEEAVVNYRGEVAATMIDGDWVWHQPDQGKT